MQTDKITYFLPINSENLGTYFFNAIIAPANVFKERADDIQNKFEDFLVLSTKQADETANCTLELIITEKEHAELDKISDDIYLFPKPLPITRVKQIIFDSEEQRKQTITAIEINTAFIPQKLDPYQKLERFAFQELSEISSNKLAADNEQNVKKFDRLLGAFALMKIATRNIDCNFSTNYFTELSKYNSVIETYIDETKIPKSPIHYNKIIKDKIETKFNEKLFNDIAVKENQQIIKDDAGMVLFEKLTGATYIASILRYYKAKEGELGTQNIDTLILNNFSELKEEYAEEVAFLYGYNRGYSSFTKEYKYSGKQVAFKYKLESLLDYYTIESIYQKTINNVEKSSAFEYLDNLFPKLTDEVFNPVISENYIEFKILDTMVRVLKKKEKPKPPKEGFGGILFHYLEKSNLQISLDENSINELNQSFKAYMKNFLSEQLIKEVKNTEVEKLNERILALEKANEKLTNKLDELSNMQNKSGKEKNINHKTEKY